LAIALPGSASIGVIRSSLTLTFSKQLFLSKSPTNYE
jgi:hypothetical protein